jgi:pimeloyl-ACP methyl ester carboxylesterase
LEQSCRRADSRRQQGTVQAGTGIKWSYPAYPIHTPGYAPGFFYDWRVDPMEVARQLNDFIEYVCTVTGHDKVNLIAYSMGSIVTMAYIQQFGYGRIAGLVLSAAALNGVTVAGEPFSGNIKMDTTGVVRYIDSLLSDDGQGALIKALAKVLAKAGVAGLGVDAVNYAIGKIKDRVYSEALTPLFATSPGMWSLIPDEYYIAAKKLLLSDTVKYSELIKKIDNYHYNVQAHNQEFINGAIARGINFGIISKYGLQGFPIGNSVNNSTDTVVDAKYSSYGATFADLGKTLGANYVQAVNDGHNHISPDNQVDASTCKYPETTWFVKDFIHMHTSDQYDALVNYILFSNKHVTVFDNPKYPQFLKMDEKTNTLSPLQAESPDLLTQLFGANSWVVLLVNLFQTSLPYFRQVFAAMS